MFLKDWKKTNEKGRSQGVRNIPYSLVGHERYEKKSNVPISCHSLSCASYTPLTLIFIFELE